MDEIIALIEPLYEKEAVVKIEQELRRYITTLPSHKPLEDNDNWYKECTMYALYPDSIHIDPGSPLKNIQKYLPTIKALGCNAMHLLPFLQSPMRDKGFDVSDYYKVREGLGGTQELKNVKKEADALGIHVFMDLVFNHVSRDHEWFQKAENGDAYYREFFIYTKETPQFLGKVYKNSSVYAQYLVDGEKTLVSVAFPEFAGELPHWVQGKDGYWYYHTYYPYQLDINWKNPEVFIELSKVLLYWASFGFNFRLDAIPFVGKSAYKHLNTHNMFTHHLTAVFNLLAHEVHPHCVFILETYERMDSEIEYFGTSNVHQAHMLYGFYLTTHLWLSLVKKDTSYIWEQLSKNKHIPIHAQWITFLRNHDELSFAYVANLLLEDMQKAILPFGKSFREGFGIAGRTYSLLGSDEKRFLMSYFLLSSLPGCMLIPYGDEYGMTNTHESNLAPEEQADVRNINRGSVSRHVMDTEKGKRIFSRMSEMVEARKILRNYMNIWPDKLDSEAGVFGSIYKQGTSQLVILINLTSVEKIVTHERADFREVTRSNSVMIKEHEVVLGPYGGIWLQK